jgi:thiol:disulfide interchange protein
MKSVWLQSLRTALAVLLLAGAWQLAYRGSVFVEKPERLVAGALMVGAMAALFAILFRRVRSEDRIARLEADLCREQNARSQADQALAEADLLLARLTARTPGLAGSEDAPPEIQLVAHLAQVQAELAQIQQHSGLDPVCAGRIGRARDRLEQVARIVRNTARAAEPG